MRVLILANDIGGLVGFRTELIKRLLADGNEVGFACPKSDGIEQLTNLGCVFFDTAIDRRGKNPFKDLKLLSCYKKIIRAYVPDLVVTYTIKPNIYGGIASRKTKTPYCANITGLGTAFETKSLLKCLVVSMYRFALKKVKCVFVENSSISDVLVANRITQNNKIKVLAGAGVNLQRYAFSQHNFSAKTKFLFVGRLMKEKGIYELMAAAKMLKDANADFSIDLYGSFEEQCKTAIDEAEKANLLTYRGRSNSLKDVYPDFDCVVLPSYHEGMSNALLEGASCGCALIASDVPGCREAVSDGVSGMLCKVKDAQSLFEKMLDYANLPNAEKEKMSLASRKIVEQRFDKNMVVDQTVNSLYRN